MNPFHIVFGLVVVNGDTPEYYFLSHRSAQDRQSLVMIGGVRLPGNTDVSFITEKMRRLCPGARFRVQELHADFRGLVNYSTINLYLLVVEPSDGDKMASLRRHDCGLSISPLIKSVLDRAGIAVPP